MNTLPNRRNHYLFVLTMTLLLPLCWQYTSAQTSPQQILDKIYKSYDSLNYLSFNITYTYNSDTVNGDFSHDKLEGNYTLAGRKAKFNLGDMEFMQNDSFFVTVYNEEKMILVANPRQVNAGSELPLRQMMDSVIHDYSLHYTYARQGTADTTKLTFTKADSAAQFLKFTIAYDSVQSLLHSIEYVFEEQVSLDSAGYILPPINRKKSLTVEFSNYRFDNLSQSVYDENQYIFFEEGEFKPVDKYNDFKVFNSRAPFGNNDTSNAQ